MVSDASFPSYNYCILNLTCLKKLQDLSKKEHVIKTYHYSCLQTASRARSVIKFEKDATEQQATEMLYHKHLSKIKIVLEVPTVRESHVTCFF